MTVRDLKKALEDFPDYLNIYTDFDREGGNEGIATEVKLFNPIWLSNVGKPQGVKIG